MFRESTSRKLCWLLVGSLVLQSTSSAFAGGFPFFRSKSKPLPQPPVSTVMLLAEQLDDLEEHIEDYGTIVPKQPDVWGEARLTKFRRQYEAVMSCQLTKFQETIQARIRRSDRAFLASAMAIGSAANQRTVIDRAADGSSRTTTGDTLIQNLVAPSKPLGSGETTEPNVSQTVTHAALSDNQIEGVALEPTIVLDQMSRYLKHLQNLRMGMEGDDTSDAPGYALHMVRIPVSVMPGDDTQQGYGAEINCTIEPYLSDELLPSTFRSMVINDLVDQISFPLAKFLDADRCEEGGLLDKYLTMLQNLHDIEVLKEIQKQIRQSLKKEVEPVSYVEPTFLNIYENNRERFSGDSPEMKKADKLYQDIDQGIEGSGNGNGDTDEFDEAFVEGVDKELEKKLGELPKLVAAVEASVREFESFSISLASSRTSRMPFPPSMLLPIYGRLEAANVALSARSLRDAEPSQAAATLVLDIQKYLTEELASSYELLQTAEGIWLWESCSRELVSAIHRRDIKQIERLRHQFFVNIRTLNQQHPVPSTFPEKYTNANLFRSPTHTLCWAIIVQSALLNDRIVKDIRKTAVERNCEHLCNCPGWLPFFLPGEALQVGEHHEVGGGLISSCFHDYTTAREVFKDYVRCKWPVHVFALDPVTSDQNVADSFSLRREMQLALAVGMSQGQIGFEQFSRYVRQIELDMETIDLNRTQVGFSHGNDTFGWRFYPRVQTPPIRGNLQVKFSDLLIGGPTEKQLLKARRLEPGTRECTALVLMPTFVPYALLDTRSNWFELTDPADRKLDLRDSVELSRDIQQLRFLSTQCTADAAMYRDGEVRRLLRTVDQLDRKLPLQSSYIQLPYQNVLGGFELLSSGAHTLAPEVYGFYGEPGIVIDTKTDDKDNNNANSGTKYDCDTEKCYSKALTEPDAANGTTIFVVGRNFSVHETVVHAGNRIARMKLISREVMEVTIPENARVIMKSCYRDGKKVEDPFVDVHIATPYGVSNHLLVPAIIKTEKEDEAEKKQTEKIEAVEKKVDALTSTVQVSSWEWKDSEGEAVFTYSSVDSGSKLSDIRWDGVSNIIRRVPPATDDSLHDPFSMRDHTVNGELAAWLVLKSGKTSKRWKTPIGPIPFTLGKTGDGSATDLEARILDKLTGTLSRGEKIDTIEVHGFLRFKEPGAIDGSPLPNSHLDASPVRKMTNLLKIKVTTGNDPVTTSAPPPTPSATSFSPPEPQRRRVQISRTPTDSGPELRTSQQPLLLPSPVQFAPPAGRRPLPR